MFRKRLQNQEEFPFPPDPDDPGHDPGFTPGQPPEKEPGNDQGRPGFPGPGDPGAPKPAGR